MNSPKHLLFVVFLLLSGGAQAQYSIQSLDHYKYVYLAPKIDHEGFHDKYGIRKMVHHAFHHSRLKVIEDSMDVHIKDSTDVLYCHIDVLDHHDNVVGPVKEYIYIKFFDYHDELIYYSKGESNDFNWSFRHIWRHAAHEALEPFKHYRHHYQPEKKPSRAEALNN